MVEITKNFAICKIFLQSGCFFCILQHGFSKKMVDTTASRAMPTPYYKIN